MRQFNFIFHRPSIKQYIPIGAKTCYLKVLMKQFYKYIFLQVLDSTSIPISQVKNPISLQTYIICRGASVPYNIVCYVIILTSHEF